MNPSIIIVAVLIALLLLRFWLKRRNQFRLEYIQTFVLPNGIYARLVKKYPEMTEADCQLVNRALRQFFSAYLNSGCRFVSMPSQAADALWHELILYTKIYPQFCRKAFGKFMHHTPAVVLSSNKRSNAGLRRCWWYACREEGINPRHPMQLPLLFALDEKLKIPDGFHYVTDCAGLKDRTGVGSSAGAIYCGGDFSSTDFDGGTDGFGDSSSGDGGDSGSSGCSGGCSAGCGGD